MVWPFSSSPSQESASPPPIQAPLAPQTLPHQPSSPPPESLTRDEKADQELAAFFAEIEADLKPPPPSKKYTRTSRTANTTSSNSTSATEPNPHIPISEHLLPTSMSCRDSFDAAFYCNSFGGRFNDLYRYGTIKSCSETWNDFWFCMKTKSYGEELKKDVIRGHWREKEVRKYGGVGDVGRGSEDVWRSRERMVERGTVFREPIVLDDDLGVGGSEGWNDREREKRRKVRGDVD